MHQNIEDDSSDKSDTVKVVKFTDTLDNKMLKAAIEGYRNENEELKEEIESLRLKIDNLRSRLSSGKVGESYREWKNSKGTALEFYVEAMLAAYCQETDIPPDQVVLHTAVKNDGSAHIYYWLERKEDNTDLESVETFNVFGD